MLELHPATFEEFEREAEHGNIVPVVRRVLADLQTPVSAFLRLANDAEYAFLLESVEGGERLARYSFLGVEPQMIVRGRGQDTLIERNGETETRRNLRAIDFLRDYFRRYQLAQRDHLAPFAGGAVGYLAYDAVRWFEPALDDGAEAQADEAVMMFFRTVLAFDRVRQQIEISSIVLTEEAGDDQSKLRELYDGAVRQTGLVEETLLGNAPAAEKMKREASSAAPLFSSNWTREDFERAVERIREHIAAGDCYQAVLSQRFTTQVAASPLEVYRALRATNPSPYMYFLRLGEESIVGASPEMLVRCRGAELEYRPIAGTRARGANEAEDVRLGAELRADEKEVAEHLMLVDLGRNDLGRVAEFGSVAVKELMAVDRFDALAACFPAGTVTGAPKVRAMQIIDALEPDRRGLYAGAVLYLDYAGNLDSCIAIRTVRMRGGRAEVQAGAGIVADSVPAREYEETLNKARALWRALEMAERGL
jgi:anthranilate synthase component 1